MNGAWCVVAGGGLGKYSKHLRITSSKWIYIRTQCTIHWHKTDERRLNLLFCHSIYGIKRAPNDTRKTHDIAVQILSVSVYCNFYGVHKKRKRRRLAGWQHGAKIKCSLPECACVCLVVMGIGTRFRFASFILLLVFFFFSSSTVYWVSDVVYRRSLYLMAFATWRSGL